MIWPYYEFTCKFWMQWTPISSVGQFFFLWCEQYKFYGLLKVISKVEVPWFDCTINSLTNSKCIEPQFLLLDIFFILMSFCGLDWKRGMEQGYYEDGTAYIKNISWDYPSIIHQGLRFVSKMTFNCFAAVALTVKSIQLEG